jgi:hypothetical protein
MTSVPFDYLPLLLAKTGKAKLTGGGSEDATTRENRTTNRSAHSAALEGSRARLADNWTKKKQERIASGAPPFDAGIPLLLRVDPNIDLDELQHQFRFEIVSEEQEGFLIVASADTNLLDLQQKLKEFAAASKGSASGAKIHELREDLTQEERLKLILSDRLYSEWGSMKDDSIYICDISVTCLGVVEIPNRPGMPKRGRLKEDSWARKQARWAEKEAIWTRIRAEAYESWDELKIERSNKIEEVVRFYKGTIHGNIDNADSRSVKLPDSFTLRIEIVSKGLKDIVLNDSRIFEVTEPEDIDTPQQIQRDLDRISMELGMQSPEPDAPRVCVIDSGIQEEHKLLEMAIDKSASRCFLPDSSNSDVADCVRNGGHGTRVAGCIIYGDSVTANKQSVAPCWIQNARVLDELGNMPKKLMPAQALRSIVSQFHEVGGTRVFNQSINVRVPCQTKHMSAWATEIDHLCNEHDILFVQSAGNIPDDSLFSPRIGVKQLLESGKHYPDYFNEPICRIANPAQSLQAITVGSVAHDTFENEDFISMATRSGESSAFSRSGLGIWDTIKPEVVEYGGDYLVNKSTGDVSYPPDGERVYPETVRSTLKGGPGVASDVVGTSFAAPKVARIAAQLQRVLPNSSCLLYRALIIQSAKWPDWANTISKEAQTKLIQRIGYGIPSMERATSNSDYRVTYITQDDGAIAAGSCHIYQVKIPSKLRGPSNEFDVRIDVTLSYTASPRRTRRNVRGYLSTCVDWTTNRKGETMAAFASRTILNDEEGLQEGSGQFPWVVHEKSQHGLPKVKRAAGTVQKDWATVKAHSLPESFCIAIRGRKGWSADPDSQARYALVVSFEVEGQQMPIYSELQASVNELIAEMELESQAEIEIEVEEES